MSEDYAREVLKRAVATTACAFDFTTTQTNTVDVVTDVVRLYIEKLGDLARREAEVGGRAKPGIQDVVTVLDQLVPEATSWKELRDFAFETVTNGDETTLIPRWVQPFPSSVPKFPASKREMSMAPEYSLPGQRGANVPAHLPAFPPAHTYKHTAPARKKRAIASQEAQQIKRIADNRSMQDAIARIENERGHQDAAEAEAVTGAGPSSSSSAGDAGAGTGGSAGQGGGGSGSASLVDREAPAVGGMNRLSKKDLQGLTQDEKTSLGVL